MFIAHDYNDQRVHVDETQSNQAYYCPYCGAPLIVKKGDIRQHHFAHSARRECSDEWARSGSYDNSDWHNDWQSKFPKCNQEIKLSLGGVSHRADVLVGYSVVEFQHSAMNPKRFDDRNNFYLNLDYKVIWLFDLTDQADERALTYTSETDYCVFSWNNPRKAFNAYDTNSGRIDLFFQIATEGDCIVRVLEVSERGFESFRTSKPMTKEAFLSYIGVGFGKCLPPILFDQEKNEQYRVFKEKHCITLDPQQERALLAVEGKNLLLAVPGAGKTTVLVARLGYMTTVKGIPPERILAVTFGKEAAEEMKSRFSAAFGADLGSRIRFCTINSLAYSIYKEYCKDNDKSIRKLVADKREERKLLTNIINVVNKEYASEADILGLSSALNYISNMNLSDAEIRDLDSVQPGISDMYTFYRTYMDENEKMDFDDQLKFAYKILTVKHEVLEQWRQRYSYICVDEAQDTSKIQHEIIRLLAEGNNLFMVGDEDQSIYGFRGAYPRALLNFRYDYKNPYILQMERNYRSTSQIVELAQSFISRNKGRYEKHMVSDRGPGSCVSLLNCESREAQFKTLVREVENNHGDTAILFRDNETAVVLIDLLMRAGVEFALKRPEMNFFQIKSIREVIAYLSLVIDPYDADALQRVCNRGILFIKSKQQNWALKRVRNAHITVFDALDEQMEYVAESYRYRAAYFRSFITSLARMTTSEAIEAIMAEGYEAYLKENKFDYWKIDTLQILAKQEPDIKAFLARMKELENLIMNGSFPKTRKSTTLSTIHSSKGLEYDSVFIADVYDGKFPSSVSNPFSRAKDNADGEQEERRLFYVGMTRAKNQLTIMAISDRPSSYIAELFPEMAAKWYSSNEKQKPVERQTKVPAPLKNRSSFQPVRPVEPKVSSKPEPTIDLSELDQQDKIARDSSGRRWVKCEICRKAKPEGEFISYGGPNHINLGICRECNRQRAEITGN